MTEEKPPPPMPVRASRRQPMLLSSEEWQSIWDAMPEGLTQDQREDLYRAAKHATELYRSLNGQLRLGIPRNKDERESAAAEIAAFRAAVEGREHPPRLSDEVLGWATYFAGPSAVESIENVIFEPQQALEVLQMTTAGIEGMGRTPRRHPDHANRHAGPQLIREWRRITGRGTRYRERADDWDGSEDGPFPRFFQAWIRVASRNPLLQGHHALREAHDVVTYSSTDS